VTLENGIGDSMAQAEIVRVYDQAFEAGPGTSVRKKRGLN
jgi:hypothetical protein